MATYKDVSEVFAAMNRGEITATMAEAECAALKAAPKVGGTLSYKISTKGAVSVYGLQRMPVTLYLEQWERVADMMPSLFAFALQYTDRPFNGSNKDGKYSAKCECKDSTSAKRIASRAKSAA